MSPYVYITNSFLTELCFFFVSQYKYWNIYMNAISGSMSQNDQWMSNNEASSISMKLKQGYIYNTDIHNEDILKIQDYLKKDA